MTDVGGFPLPPVWAGWLRVANSQATLDGEAAERDVCAAVRAGWRPRAAGGVWDDLADDLEPLAARDWNPTLSIRAYARVHKLGCDVRRVEPC